MIAIVPVYCLHNYYYTRGDARLCSQALKSIAVKYETLWPITSNCGMPKYRLGCLFTFITVAIGRSYVISFSLNNNAYVRHIPALGKTYVAGAMDIYIDNHKLDPKLREKYL